MRNSHFFSHSQLHRLSHLPLSQAHTTAKNVYDYSTDTTNFHMIKGHSVFPNHLKACKNMYSQNISSVL